MIIPDCAKYIRIPRSLEGKREEFLVFHGGRVQKVFTISPEKEEGYYYYPVYGLKESVSVHCTNRSIMDSLEVII